jgi:TRAP-type C4-dicarboxylate transport system permease small subunit
MRHVYQRLALIEVHVAAFGFIGCCLVIFVAAILRGIGRPLNWAWDISLFLFAWSVFLAADAAMRHDKLVNVDLLITRFPARVQHLLTLASYLLILVFLGALFIYGAMLSYTTRARTFQGTPGFSYTWVTLSVPVGAALQITTVTGKLRRLIGRIRKRDIDMGVPTDTSGRVGP